jgi:hypothetical protein
VNDRDAKFAIRLGSFCKVTVKSDGGADSKEPMGRHGMRPKPITLKAGVYGRFGTFRKYWCNVAKTSWEGTQGFLDFMKIMTRPNRLTAVTETPLSVIGGVCPGSERLSILALLASARAVRSWTARDYIAAD